MTDNPGGKPRTWFKMKRQDEADAEGDPEIDPNRTQPADAEILVYDEIGMWGVSAADFDRELKALGDVKSINMRINSPGGDSFAGIAIYNTLQAHPATITTRVDGIAASAASLIAMAGDKIIMPDNTFMLVHEPLALTIGPASAHRAMAADLDRVSASYANVYAARTGQTLEAVNGLMAEDRLMSAAEAKERGYADETTRPVAMMASAFSLGTFPEKHRAILAAAGFPAVLASGDTATPPPELDTPALQVTPPPAVEDPAPPAAVEDPPPAAAYGPAQVTETLELCALAGVAAAVAQGFISAQTPIAKVRASLLEARAQAGDQHGIVPVAVNGGGTGAGTEAGPAIIASKRRLQAIIKMAEQKKISVAEAASIFDTKQ